MKRVLEFLGVISIIIFSLIYSDKSLKVIREYDDIMIKIKEENEFTEPSNATIFENTIIPGKKGIKVDIEKSYLNMKRYGKYDKSLLIYKETEPLISIKDNYDKFVISGNKKIKQVSLLFVLTKNSDLSSLIKILNENKVNATIFVDINFYTQNNLSIINENNNEIGNLSLNLDYSDSSFGWLNSKIKKLTNTTYCYDEEYNLETLKHCSLYKIYTITPSIIISSNPYSKIKKEVQNGSIISFKLNKNIIDELSLSIKYLKSKNYNIVTLSKLLSE